MKYVALSALTFNALNPRTIKQKELERLAQSIKEFPEMLEIRPIVVDECYMIIGGNMRARAAAHIGLSRVPVLQVVGWSQDQKEQFIIRDNKHAGVWDYDFLVNNWSLEIVEMEFPHFHEIDHLTNRNRVVVEWEDGLPESIVMQKISDLLKSEDGKYEVS